ncbi:MAG: SGNH/GDSL hydrolase family protein [Candidatus Omnitrophica bacterium]|nr:SGNH/GDSL hydrolase family protein [Candidatus Omnitrophota bacterium]
MIRKIVKVIKITCVFIVVLFLLEIILRLSSFRLNSIALQKETGIDLGLLDAWHDENVFKLATNGLFYELIPNDEYCINRDGYRGPIVARKRTLDVYRIMVLGDSTAFGAGVEWDETFIHILDNMIERSHIFPVEYINAGVPGYTSLQGMRMFEQKYAQYKPDLVLTYFGHNDVNQIFPYADKELRNVPPNFLKLYDMTSRVRVFRLINYFFIKYIIQKILPLKQRVSAEDYMHNLHAIAQRAQQYGGQVRFIVPTVVDMGNGNSPHLIEKVEIKDKDAIHVHEYFMNGRWEWRDLFLDECHPTKRGHQIIAQAIYEHILREDIFPQQLQNKKNRVA